MLTYQERAKKWLLQCFGPEIASDRMERNHRFLEEALELVQAAGATREDALQLVDYVYGRPAGDPHQEVGGVMLTLAALCQANGIDVLQAAEAELERAWNKIEVIRAKQQAKPVFGPLPAASLAEGGSARPVAVPAHVLLALENIAARQTPPGLPVAEYAMHALADSGFPFRAPTTNSVGEAPVHWTEDDALSVLKLEGDGAFSQDDVDSTLRQLQHIDTLRRLKALSGKGAGHAGEPLPHGWSTKALALRANGQADVSNVMKTVCMGEFTFSRSEACGKCAIDGPSSACDECNGDQVVEREVTVPWDTCKAIFKRMVEVAPEVVSTTKNDESAMLAWLIDHAELVHQGRGVNLWQIDSLVFDAAGELDLGDKHREIKAAMTAAIRKHQVHA